ncbi:MAG: heavy metal translocating P-type ATPase [Treponema berlinense]|uniref:heavy metal translocating P-type ATPase n=1 Tax=Treponema berlinense TaxID=225004 RepID=UPI0023F49576|nr:heavy metal translocating P-type ATPase [Treponema berlinense]MDD5834708.1 heavy metal translocating P-type ATPase [Treponema berlinense]
MEKLMEDFEKSNLEEKENNIEEKNRADGCQTEECKNEHEHHRHKHSCPCCHSHDCGDEEDEHEEEGELSLRQIICAIVLFGAALAVEHLSVFRQILGSIQFGSIGIQRLVFLVLYFVAYIICGKNVIKSAVKNILHGEIFDEKFLMSIASVGAIFVGEIGEAVAVMIFYNLGEFFQDYAVDKSRNSISALMDIRPDKAFVVRNGKVEEEKPENVKIGEIIEVKPGERVALDGEIEEGSSFMDTSALTGESVPRKVDKGSAILAGFVNSEGVVRIRVTKTYGESAVTRILELTEKAAEAKAKSEKFITRFAKYYTPIVCILALCVAVLPPLALSVFAPEIFAQYGWHTWIYRALMFLVVSCPCALVISVPLSFFSGIGAASRHGILIKGSNYIEALSKVDTAVFDKTGTLTKGTFAVSKVFAVEGVGEDELLALAAHAEYYSVHPISKSLCSAHQKMNLKNGLGNSCCELCIRKNAREISGHGIKIELDQKTVLAGNEKLLEKENIQIDPKIKIQLEEKKLAGTTVHVAENGVYKGCIVISDELKKDAKKTIGALKKCGVRQTAMLTGDNQKTAQIVAGELGIDRLFAGLLPEDKVNRVKELIEQKTQKKGSLVYVGDGINDSPVLACADVGVAMGALGSDAAIEAADVVIMDDKPERLIDAIKISRSTMAVVWQNVVLSLGIKVAIMVLGTLGVTGMWLAVFGDVGVTFFAVLNAMRILRK